jgi:uncharacterized membrane protein
MDNQEQKQIQLTQAQSLFYSGPLPTSKEFAGYEQALPGAAERILVISEKEVEHRHRNEDKIIEKSLKLSDRGQILAFAIALLSIASVYVTIFLDKPLGAIAPAIIALTSLAAVFVGKNRQK